MSVEIKTFCGIFFPKKSAAEKHDLKPLARSVQAQNKKTAGIVIQSKFIEAYPQHVDDYFDPKIWEDRVGLPRPGPHEFSSDFLSGGVIWNKEANEPESIAYVDDNDDGDTIPPGVSPGDSQTRAYALALHGHCDQLSPGEYGLVLDLINDTERTLNREIGEALFRTPPALALLPERQAELIAAIRAKFNDSTQWTTIKSFADKWISTPPEKRAEPSPPAPGKHSVSLGGGNQTDRSPDLVHTLDTLEIEIALGVVARRNSFDIYQIPSAVLKQAKAEAGGNPEIAAWRARLGKTPGILDFSRAAIIALVKAAPEGIYSQTPELVSYISNNLTESDHAHPAATVVQLACGTLTFTEDTPDENACEQVFQSAPGVLVSKDEPNIKLEKTAPAATPAGNRTVFTLEELTAGPDRPAMTQREIDICCLINDTLSGGTNIVSASEASEQLEKLGLRKCDFVPALITDLRSIEQRNGDELADNEIPDLVVDALDGWRGNADERQEFLMEAVTNWRNTLATYDELAQGGAINFAPALPLAQPLDTCRRWQLTIAALQGLCSNPAFALSTNDIPRIAASIGRSTFQLAQEQDNE